MSNSLENHHIYNLGQIARDDDRVLLYAPLSCNCVVAGPDELRLLESAAEGLCEDAEYTEIFKILSCRTEVPRITGVNDFVNLSVLPTNACNFSCSYCYSAKARSVRTIDYQVVEKMIRWFVSTDRKSAPPLFITIFGGGEPMLCWNKVVRPAIDLIEELRLDYPSKIHINIITNGSIIPTDFISVCRKADVNISVSFEILEDLQNQNRRNYRTVLKNILTLCENGIIPSINSVITDDSVEKMPEMVTESAETLPEVKYLSFEPVTGHHTEEYYQKFTENFFKAQQVADGYGIKLTTSALRNVDVTVERYCAGELALTASGDLTSCPCISEPSQPGYDRWVYGHASDHCIEIDNERLQKILSLDVNANPWCDKCFARYNCGGGCLNNLLERNGRQDLNYCRFFRNFLRTILIKRAL